MSEKFGDGISQADTSSDVVPSGDLCLGEAVTRRQHLRQLLVLASTGALAVSGLSGCGKDAPKKSGKTAGNRPEGISKKVSPQKDVAETIRDNPISSPTFERIDGKVDFPVPNNVVMDKDQFVKSALQIIGVFENDLLPRFFSEIESRPDILKDVSKTNAVTLRCVQWLIDSIKKVYSGHTNGVPLVEGKMVVAETCDFINKFLNPAGYYLGFNYMGGKLSFDLCKISDSFLVRVSMDDESIDVPCLGLDSIAASPYKNNSIGGRGDSFLKYAVVFNQPCGVCDTVHRSVKTHPAFSSTMPNREQFDKMLLNGFFRHEATHVALGSRFPHSSGLNPDKNFKGNDQYKLPIVAKFGDDIVDYSGSYNLFQIHTRKKFLFTNFKTQETHQNLKIYTFFQRKKCVTHTFFQRKKCIAHTFFQGKLDI